MQHQPRGPHDITTVSLLGSFDLRCNAKSIALSPGPQRLLAFLALNPRRLTRIYVAGMLWLQSSQAAANANLRSALWRLRQLPFPLLETTPTHLALAPEVVVDLSETLATARRVGSDHGSCRGSEIDRMIDAGELLADWYEDWVIIERERFRQARLHALEDLCHALTEDGSYARAVEVGLIAVAGEPLRESAHRAVMRVHLAEGNRGEAIRQYELCRRALRPLGLEPSAATQSLRARCARGDATVTLTR